MLREAVIVVSAILEERMFSSRSDSLERRQFRAASTCPVAVTTIIALREEQIDRAKRLPNPVTSCIV
jgi:hypothetical protein